MTYISKQEVIDSIQLMIDSKRPEKEIGAAIHDACDKGYFPSTRHAMYEFSGVTASKLFRCLAKAKGVYVTEKSWRETVKAYSV